MTCKNLFSIYFNSIISKFPGRLSDLLFLGKGYQHPCISSIRITIAISWNNWFQNYLNSIFGQFPGRLSDLLFVVIIVKGNCCAVFQTQPYKVMFPKTSCKCTMKITLIFVQDIMLCKWLWKVKSKLIASPPHLRIQSMIIYMR